MFIAQPTSPGTGDVPPVPVVVPLEAKARDKTSKQVTGGQSIEVSQVNPHYITPGIFAAAGRFVVGGPFMLDVASCEIANRIIQALKWFGPDLGTDGLAKNWGTRKKPKAVWCNPPGGRGKMINGVWVPSKTGPQSSQRVFFERFVQQWKDKRCWGIFLSFNPDVILRNYFELLTTLPHCIPNFRPKFQTWLTCINNADVNELRIVGLTEPQAQRIIAHRPYADVDDLKDRDRTGDGQPVLDELGFKKLGKRLTALDPGGAAGEFQTDDSPTKGGLVILFPPPDTTGINPDLVIDRFLDTTDGFGQFKGGEYGCVHDPRPPRSIGDIFDTTDNLDLEQLLILQNLINQKVDAQMRHQALMAESAEIQAANEVRYAQARANGNLQIKWVDGKNGERYGPYWVTRWTEGTKRKMKHHGKAKPGG